MSTTRALPAVLAIGLAASLAANGYLLATRRAPDAAAPTNAASGVRTPPTAGPASASPTTLPAPPAAERAARPALPATCTDQLDELATQLADSQRELQGHLDLAERYALASRSPATEAKVQPFLTTAFDGAPPSIAHDLECHGAVCTLTILEHEGDDFDWMQRLQDRSFRTGARVGMIGFFGGAPAQDPVSKEPVQSHVVRFDLADENAVSGLDVLQGLVAAYRASPEVAACKARFPAAGHLSVRLALDAAAGTIAIDAGGTLAVVPGGRCLLDELRRRTTGAAAALVPGTLGGTLYFAITVP